MQTNKQTQIKSKAPLVREQADDILYRQADTRILALIENIHVYIFNLYQTDDIE